VVLGTPRVATQTVWRHMRIVLMLLLPVAFVLVFAAAILLWWELAHTDANISLERLILLGTSGAHSAQINSDAVLTAFHPSLDQRGAFLASLVSHAEAVESEVPVTLFGGPPAVDGHKNIPALLDRTSALYKLLANEACGVASGSEAECQAFEKGLFSHGLVAAALEFVARAVRFHASIEAAGGNLTQPDATALLAFLNTASTPYLHDAFFAAQRHARDMCVRDLETMQSGVTIVAILFAAAFCITMLFVLQYLDGILQDPLRSAVLLLSTIDETTVRSLPQLRTRVRNIADAISRDHVSHRSCCASRQGAISSSG